MLFYSTFFIFYRIIYYVVTNAIIGGYVMNSNLTPEELTFALFEQAVKCKDKNQFAYFHLYYSIAHCEDKKTHTENLEEELTL